MTTKHTPGPWNGSSDGAVYSNDGEIVARVVGVKEPSFANRRLIAAAPELLEALKAIVSAHPYALTTLPVFKDSGYCRQHGTAGCEPCLKIEDAVAAIRKAEAA
jgi:alpha-amylase/alpha-mannosidase (GH57 family)